jgi:hypothetical protein
MNTNSNPKCGVDSVKFLEQVHTVPAHRNTTNRIDQPISQISQLVQWEAKYGEHKDLFYRSSDSLLATKAATKVQWILLFIEELFRMWVYSILLPPSRVFFQPLPYCSKFAFSLAKMKRNMHKFPAAHHMTGSSPGNL